MEFEENLKNFGQQLKAFGSVLDALVVTKNCTRTHKSALKYLTELPSYWVWEFDSVSFPLHYCMNT